MQGFSRFTKPLVFAASAWLAFATAAHADVQLSIRDGRVTLVAKDATLRQILTEWSRVGKTTVLNLERIPGGPLTLELRDVPEGEALDILLRNLSGYMAAPRTSPVADGSVYASIAVMPTVAQPLSRAASATSPTPAPFTPPTPFVQNDDEENAAAQLRNAAGQPLRVPTFTTFPGGQPAQPGNNVPRPVLPVVRPGVVAAPPVANPNDFPPSPVAPPFTNAPVQPSPGQTPGAIGVSAPGMIVPAPSTAQPGQVPQPQRPPGD
jgi:hypothetical protein